MRDPDDRAYVENYPPLREWLRAKNARCDIQVGDGGHKHDPEIMIERWQVPDDPDRLGSGGEILVMIYPEKRGWNIYTCDRSNSIAITLADVERRLGLSGDLP